MDFSGLVKGVQDFWDFIWPPILCLTALFGITTWVAPLLFGSMWSKLMSWRPTDQRQIQFVKMSKRFGFDKLLPIICAFFLIFFLDVIRNVVVMGGQALPPVISYVPAAMVLQHKDAPTVRCLWQTRAEAIRQQRAAAAKSAAGQGPGGAADADSANMRRAYMEARYGAVSFEDVSRIIDSSVAEASAQHKDSPRVIQLQHAEDRAATAHMVFSGLKFLFVYALVLGFVELRRSSVRRRVAFRTFAVLAVVVLGLFGYFLRYLKMTEDVEEAKIYIAQAYPVKGSLECESTDFDSLLDLEQSYEQAALQEQAWRRRWWSLQFPSTEIFTWTWKQFRE